MNSLMRYVSSALNSKDKSGALTVRREGAYDVAPSSRGKKQAAAAALPNATIVYGIGASFLFASSYLLFGEGRWFAGLMTLIIGGCLAGFALHLLKHRD